MAASNPFRKFGSEFSMTGVDLARTHTALHQIGLIRSINDVQEDGL